MAVKMGSWSVLYLLFCFRFQYWLHSDNPVYFHVINVLLHTCNTWLLMHMCLHVLLVGEQCSFLTALLFAVHPVHVEAVSQVTPSLEHVHALYNKIYRIVGVQRHIFLFETDRITTKYTEAKLTWVETKGYYSNISTIFSGMAYGI